MARRVKPAYAVEAWFNGEMGAGPQCSANGEFCFLCEFSEAGDECGHVADIKALVRLMVSQKKEMPVIVAAVQEAYNERVQAEVEVTAPNGKLIKQPNWSRSSISCHLLYSTEFPELFQSVVVQIHQSLIMQLNKQAIANGEVDTSTTEELRKMVVSLKKWQS